MLLSSDDPEVSPLFHALDPKLLPSLLINPVGLTLLISAAPLAQRARSQGHRDPMLCTHEHMLLDIAELNGFKGHDLRHIGNQKLRAMCDQIHFADMDNLIANGWCVTHEHRSPRLATFLLPRYQDSQRIGSIDTYELLAKIHKLQQNVPVGTRKDLWPIAQDAVQQFELFTTTRVPAYGSYRAGHQCGNQDSGHGPYSLHPHPRMECTSGLCSGCHLCPLLLGPHAHGQHVEAAALRSGTRGKPRLANSAQTSRYRSSRTRGQDGHAARSGLTHERRRP